MVFGMEFEWIVALFMSVLYMMFPMVSVMFLLNKGLQLNLMSSDSSWVIWFGMIFQISALFINNEILVGGFSEYFEIPLNFWSKAIIYI